MGRYKKVMFIGGKQQMSERPLTEYLRCQLYKIIEKYDTIQEAFYENRI